jgi:hypothetical protein
MLPFSLHSQGGLEGIIVEKYYVSSIADAADSTHSGFLIQGSVTYRIYLDLLPGYKFQAAYGAPGHPLRIESTEPFYNHIEVGATNPNIIPERALSNNIALLDSWLSVGAAAENHLGVLKKDDSDAADEYIKLQNGFLSNKEKSKDITPQERDGMVRADSIPFPTFFQMDTCLSVLGSTTAGSKIIINNGAWACLGKGSAGADPMATNTILIAQLTTAGELSFELNIMIGAPDGTSQRYVARNPSAKEFSNEDLILAKSTKKKKKKEKIAKGNIENITERNQKQL